MDNTVTLSISNIRSQLSRFITSGRAWSLFPVALLGVLVTVQVVLYGLSTNDPSFSVEPDYYQKAVKWDEHRDRQASSARLGWTASASVSGGPSTAVLRIELRDAQRDPVRRAKLQVEAFANSRASNVQTLNTEEVAPGVYSAAFQVFKPGLWELRIRARQGLDVFHSTVRIDNVGTPGLSPPSLSE